MHIIINVICNDSSNYTLLLEHSSNHESRRLYDLQTIVDSVLFSHSCSAQYVIFHIFIKFSYWFIPQTQKIYGIKFQVNRRFFHLIECNNRVTFKRGQWRRAKPQAQLVSIYEISTNIKYIHLLTFQYKLNIVWSFFVKLKQKIFWLFR